MGSRVAVTGIGVVSPGAVGNDAFRALLSSGSTAAAAVERFDTAGLKAHRAALVRDFNAKQFIPAMKLRRMNTLSRFLVSAARLAFEEAQPCEPATTGVAIGTAFGPVQTSIDYLQEYVAKGPSLAPPQLFAESVANAPGSHVAIEWGLRGFNTTLTQRESSAMSAAMYACSQLLKGSVSAALIGGVEEASSMLFTVLDGIAALAHGDPEEAKPFDAARNGFLLGEGSAALVAVPAERAGAGSAYGYFSGFGIARDKSAPLSDWGDDHQSVVRAMTGALDDAGVSAGDVDAIYASANGSVRGDRLEWRGIQELFGSRVPPVVAVKGIFGEYAAGGAFQLVAALFAMRDQLLHGSPGFERGEEGFRLDIVREARPAALRHVLVNSLSAGGGIVSAVISREAA